jgi:hypothetical protein
MNTVALIPVGARVEAARDIPYIEPGRVVARGTAGSVTYYYESFKAYQVKFDGFGKEMFVTRSQIEPA